MTGGGSSTSKGILEYVADNDGELKESNKKTASLRPALGMLPLGSGLDGCVLIIGSKIRDFWSNYLLREARLPYNFHPAVLISQFPHSWILVERFRALLQLLRNRVRIATLLSPATLSASSHLPVLWGKTQ